MNIRIFERASAVLGRSELERGHVVRLAPATMPVGRVATNALMMFGDWLRRPSRGRVFVRLGLITRPDTVREIPVAYFSCTRLTRRPLPSGFATIPPNVAVEIVEPEQSWARLLKKTGEYLSMGVDRVWIVEPNARRLCVLKPDDGPTILNESATLTDGAVLPGFRCRVAEFFDGLGEGAQACV